MKKLIHFLLLLITLTTSAQSDHLVISQVFGGGGNTSAPFTHDFIELFNPTKQPVLLDGMSLQYSGAASATWNSNKVVLSGTISPGHYFLVQLTSGGTSGAALPAPDLSATAITLSASSGKVALVSNTTTLSGNCPAVALIDMVGYGGADCFEGAAGPATSNITSLKRIDQGCTDRNNNATDFVVAVPDPRNSTAHTHSCEGSFKITTVGGNPFCIDDTQTSQGELDFTATGNFINSEVQVVLSDANGSFVTYSIVGTITVDGLNPSGTIPFVIPARLPSGSNYRLRLQSDQPSITGASEDIEIINKTKDPAELTAAPYANELLLQWINPGGCFDEIMIVVKEHAEVLAVPSGDGSAYAADPDFSGNGSVFDGGRVVYKGTVSGQRVTGLSNGTHYYIKAFSRRGAYWSSGVSVTGMPRVVPLPGEIVINQVSPDFNGAQDEYIELVNLSNKTFDLADLTLKFTNADGRNVVAGGTLSGLLQPHSYWLLSPNASITVGKTKELIPDQVIDGGFGAQNQQVGLVRKTDNTVIDALAYGTVNLPVYVETNAAVNPPADGGLKRITDGADGNNNRIDFARVAQADIDLQNSRSRLANKDAILAAGDYRVVKVTGNAMVSGMIRAQKTELVAGILSVTGFRMITDTITGGNDTTYIRTNGTGSLTVQNVDSLLFPVGISTYNPVTIIHGEKRDWQVTVADDFPNTNTPFSPTGISSFVLPTVIEALG